jgi:hypothetical protein
MMALGIVVAACSGGPATSSPGPSPTPTGSGSPCPAAPTPGNLDAWAPPSSTPPVLPVLISADQVCGANRFLFGLVGPDNRPIAAPDRSVSVAFYDLGADPASPVATVEGTFIWAIDDVVGVYVVQVAFETTGVWGAEFSTTAADGSPATVRMTFNVIEHGHAVQIGERAPASQTKTLADVGDDLARISTDTNPVKRFYETSVDAALAAHVPFVLAFATPKFCVTGQCGPTLERVKPVAAAFPDVTVINVEPYELMFEGGSLQPVLSATGELVPVEATIEWGLPSEPWIYVVDRDGIVTASFEGIVSEEELQAAVEAVR